jgi:sodium/proline symporter
MGLVGLAVALGEVRAIFYFVLFAWSGIACAFTPVVLCSLFWKRTTKAGAVAGMIGGFVITVLWVVAFKERFYDLYEMIPGFAAGFATTIVVSLMTESDAKAIAELEDVHRSVGPIF